MSQKRRQLFNKVMICFLFIIFLLTAGSILYFQYMITEVVRGEENLTTYEKHIAMIVENREDTFWKTVYESARKAGEEQGYYVELYGGNLPIDYSRQELLRIAIDASVDGIILEGDDSEELVKEIARAEEKEIPVVTVLSDSTQSTRECYVGINSYHLGQTFGKQVLQNVTSDMLTVCVNLP